jgi:hypothetical protein
MKTCCVHCGSGGRAVCHCSTGAALAVSSSNFVSRHVAPRSYFLRSGLSVVVSAFMSHRDVGGPLTWLKCEYDIYSNSSDAHME